MSPDEGAPALVHGNYWVVRVIILISLHTVCEKWEEAGLQPQRQGGVNDYDHQMGTCTSRSARPEFPWTRLVPTSSRYLSTVMLALRRLPRYAPRLTRVRGNATLEAASESQAQASTHPPPPPVTAKTATPAPADDPAPEETTDGASLTEQPKYKQREWPKRRPYISLERPREWNRPIAKGVEPAYDYALRYILRDAQFLRKELEELRVRVKAEEAKPEGERDVAALEELREKVRILEIQSEVNLPEVRWKARNGMGELVPLKLFGFSPLTQAELRVVSA